MSQDFVRQLPGTGLKIQRKAGLGNALHLDVPMLLLLLIISAYGLVILYSAVGQQIEPVISQGIKSSRGPERHGGDCANITGRIYEARTLDLPDWFDRAGIDLFLWC